MRLASLAVCAAILCRELRRPARAGAGHAGAPRRQHRHGKRGPATRAGPGRARRSHRRDRHRRGDRAADRTFDRDHRPRGTDRRSGVHRGAWTLHGARSGADGDRPHGHHELRADRGQGRRSGEDRQAGRLDPRARLAPGEVDDRRRRPTSRAFRTTTRSVGRLRTIRWCWSTRAATRHSRTPGRWRPRA